MAGIGLALSGFMLMVYLTTVDAQVFSVASTQTFRGNEKLEPVPFDKIITNTQGVYNTDSHNFVCDVAGAYYFTFSAGREEAKGAHLILERDGVQGVEIKNTNTYTTGVTVSSRGILNNVQQGVGMHMVARLSDDLSLQGDAFTYQTSWSGFRYNDLSETVIAFSVGLGKNHTSSANPLMYDTEVLNIGIGPNPPFNMSSGIFRVQSAGIYFFHVSAGAREEREVRINVTRNWPSLEMASLYRTSRNHQGVDTTSRSFLMELSLTDEIRVINDFGSELYSDAGMQVSFSGFLYSLAANPFVNCFYAYKSESWESPLPESPFVFDSVLLNRGQGYNETSSVYNVIVGGAYFFSISVGAQPSKTVSLSLQLNAQPVMRLEQQSTLHNGIDTFSRDIILQLVFGDVLHVVADGGSATYSDNGAQTSFLGFRIRD